MSPNAYQKDLIELIEQNISAFNQSLPAAEKSLYDIILNLLKDLELDSRGRIINNVANLNKIARIRSGLEKSILSDKWVKSVQKLLRAFKSIEQLQLTYFKSLDPAFKQNNLLNTITAGAIDATVQSLTEDGIRSGVIAQINKLLQDNIHSQVSFSKMVEDMRKFLLGENDLGILARYASKFVTDALNQYSATYTQAVAQDLKFEWYMYTGTLLTTSRQWCKKMVEKKYIHVSEFTTVLNGEFKDGDVPLNQKTGLPQGMFENTTEENLPIKRGGHNCGHQFTPVHANVVPLHIRQALKAA